MPVLFIRDPFLTYIYEMSGTSTISMPSVRIRFSLAKSHLGRARATIIAASATPRNSSSRVRVHHNLPETDVTAPEQPPPRKTARPPPVAQRAAVAEPAPGAQA